MTAGMIRKAIANLPDDATIVPVLDNDPGDDVNVTINNICKSPDGKSLEVHIEVVSDDEIDDVGEAD